MSCPNIRGEINSKKNKQLSLFQLTVFLRFCDASSYNWIANQLDAHEKSISQAIRRVTKNPRPPLESSRPGELRSEWSIFVYAIF